MPERRIGLRPRGLRELKRETARCRLQADSRLQTSNHPKSHPRPHHHASCICREVPMHVVWDSFSRDDELRLLWMSKKLQAATRSRLTLRFRSRRSCQATPHRPRRCSDRPLTIMLFASDVAAKGTATYCAVVTRLTGPNSSIPKTRKRAN